MFLTKIANDPKTTIDIIINIFDLLIYVNAVFPAEKIAFIIIINTNINIFRNIFNPLYLLFPINSYKV